MEGGTERRRDGGSDRAREEWREGRSEGGMEGVGRDEEE